MVVVLYENSCFLKRSVRNIVTLGIYSRNCRHVEAPIRKKNVTQKSVKKYFPIYALTQTLFFFIYSSTGTYLQSSASY